MAPPALRLGKVQTIPPCKNWPSYETDVFISRLNLFFWSPVVTPKHYSFGQLKVLGLISTFLSPCNTVLQLKQKLKEMALSVVKSEHIKWLFLEYNALCTGILANMLCIYSPTGS